MGIFTLIAFAWTEKRRLILASLCMVICALATGGYAFLVGPVLRSLFVGEAEVSLGVPTGATLARYAEVLSGVPPVWIGAAIIGVAAIRGVAYLGQNALAGHVGQNLLHRLRLRLYEELLRLNPLHRDANVRGELISRFTVDVEDIEKSISQGLIAFVRDGLHILALAGVALALDPFMGVIGLLAFPPVALVIVRLGKRLRKRRAEVQRAFGILSSAVEESASGLQIIRAFGAGEMMAERFKNKSREIYRSTVRAVVLKALSSPFNEVMAAIALATTLWFSHKRIDAGQITPEAFISFFSALLLLYQPVKGLGSAQHAVQSGLAALERLPLKGGDLTEKARVRSGGSFPAKSGKKEGISVELRDVYAEYTPGNPVLKNLSLRLPRAGRIAVVGRSGSGKTSLLNLLQGFLPAQGGEVSIDGKPVVLSPEFSSGVFSPVSQEPFLFDDTIRMNVLVGNRFASEEDVRSVCRVAGVEDFSRSLPGNLDFGVGPGGRSLSVGQRQRICLARALLSDAPVLLLDEVTASLDGQTEEEIIGRVEDVLEGRTVVLVTHRLSSAKWADDVVFIEEGEARVQGPADALLQIKPELRQIFGGQRI